MQATATSRCHPGALPGRKKAMLSTAVFCLALTACGAIDDGEEAATGTQAASIDTSAQAQLDGETSAEATTQTKQVGTVNTTPTQLASAGSASKYASTPTTSSPPTMSNADAACGTKGRPYLATYVGNDPADLIRFEQWLGRSVDAHQVHSGSADWNDWSSSISWLINVWQSTPRPMLWSIPLIPKGATLAAAGRGEYDDRYAQAANELMRYSHSHKIYVRTGWEFNGDWFHWNAIGRPAEYIAAFRRFVTVFRSVSDRFVFEWAPNIHRQSMNPETAYPGDAYVDLIGLDFYYKTQYDGNDAVAAWNKMLNDPYGLKWHQKFAADRGKPTTYAEWGIASNASSEYMRLAAEWFRTNPVVYHAYWNSNAAYPGKLSDNQYPDSGKAYITQFGSTPLCPF